MKNLFKKSQSGQKAFSLPKDESVWSSFQPERELLRHDALPMPELSELDIMRHFSNLARRNIGIDTHFYPLGSCTMKLNPRVNEWAARLPAFSRAHPLAPSDTVQGCLFIIEDLLKMLCKITGMTQGSICPNAGAQGELTGIKMIAAYHHSRGDNERNEILVPDTAHGTNPATAAMAGFKTIPLTSSADGDIDIEQLKAKVGSRTAGLMLTNPNTLGLFSKQISAITKIVHEAGGLLYYDGANLNAIMGITKPGDMGFDVMHLNLHKTFSTPHGGGGPGAGPVLCNDKLKPFLPVPIVSNAKEEWQSKQSIGSISTFFGNFAVCLRAYLYAKLHGYYGLRRVAENAVLNANYLKAKIKPLFTVPFQDFCMHEFVVQADRFLPQGIKAQDIAKRLLDYGFHAPTVYFPLIIKECMLIEPTETESKATLDKFVAALESIVKEAESNPEVVKTAPHKQIVKRLDEVKAVKEPILKAF